MYLSDKPKSENFQGLELDSKINILSGLISRWLILEAWNKIKFYKRETAIKNYSLFEI